MAYGLSGVQHREIALMLLSAEKSRVPISKLTRKFPDMCEEDSYAIQEIGKALRLESGGRIVGRKIGLTSKAMMAQLNASSPDFGYLLDSMWVPEGNAVQTAELMQPRIEGELAFIIGKDIYGPGVTASDLYCLDIKVVPCFEIIDTRIENYDVTVLDTIADNAGAARYVLGHAPKPLSDVNTRLLGMVMEKNGELYGTAAGAEVMGSPLNSLVWLINKLGQFGVGLKAGDIVLSGAFMAAADIFAGDSFYLSVTNFPTLGVKFK